MRTIPLALFSLLVGCACANQARPAPDDSSPPTDGDASPPDSEAGSDADSGTSPAPNGGVDAGATPEAEQMRITVGSAVFLATLEDNPTAQAFKGLLPLTLNMTDVNGNEKYYQFADSLPANASNPGTIHAGDVMLYGSNGLVLFYETFSTSYSYTRIGRIDDASGLAAALGTGNVTVTFAP